MLLKLLESSRESRTLAVGASDLGNFISAHPHGRSIVAGEGVLLPDNLTHLILCACGCAKPCQIMHGSDTSCFAFPVYTCGQEKCMPGEFGD